MNTACKKCVFILNVENSAFPRPLKALRDVHGVSTAVSEIYAMPELFENARIDSPAMLMRPDVLKVPNARTTPA